MNILLWVLQIVLAVFCLAGGAYKAFNVDEMAHRVRELSRGGWRALGVLEMLCGVLLIVPAATQWMPILTPLAAAAVAMESLGTSALYARHSLRLVAANPLVWSVAMALMAAFVAYGRYAIRPLT
jgi:DoxX-like family